MKYAIICLAFTLTIQSQENGNHTPHSSEGSDAKPDENKANSNEGEVDNPDFKKETNTEGSNASNSDSPDYSNESVIDNPAAKEIDNQNKQNSNDNIDKTDSNDNVDKTYSNDNVDKTYSNENIDNTDSSEGIEKKNTDDQQDSKESNKDINKDQNGTLPSEKDRSDEIKDKEYFKHFVGQNFYKKKECSCKPVLFAYNIIAINNLNLECSGGCGGSQFSYQVQYHSISKIKIHYVTNNLYYFEFTYSDGKYNKFGIKNPKMQYNTIEFEFKKHEKLVNYLTICEYYNSNNAKKHTSSVGCIKFETNLGRKFFVGMETKTQQRYYVHGSYLTGIYGAYDQKLKRLGVILMESYEKSIITNIHYQNLMLFSDAYFDEHQRVVNFCNDTPKETEGSHHVNKQYGYRRTVKINTLFEEPKHIVLSVKTPVLMKNNYGAYWALENNLFSSINVDNNFIDVLADELKSKNSPYSITQNRVNWTVGTIWDLPIKIQYMVKFKNGYEQVFVTTGTWSMTVGTKMSIDKRVFPLDHLRCDDFNSFNIGD